MSMPINDTHKHARTGRQLQFVADYQVIAGGEVSYTITVHGNGVPTVFHRTVLLNVGETPEAGVRRNIAQVLDGMPVA